MRPITVRFAAAVNALILEVAGARWGAEAALASIAPLAIAVNVIERRLESRSA